MSKKSFYAKRPIGIDVNAAARQRINKVFDHFDRTCVSFSGGKDSGILLNLVLEEARKRNKLPIDVLIVDLEAQYQHTIEFITRMIDTDDVRVHWVCLPISLRNSPSLYQPKWICWDPKDRDKWVREYPVHEGVINDPSHFPFFVHGMEFEEFVPKFNRWLANDEPVACFVGIRADESINRLRTVKRDDKAMWRDYKWTTQLDEGVYSIFPIYDWKTRDIWLANKSFGWDHNKIYDLMHQAGVPYGDMRLCQPYGDDQRKGLWLYRMLEPETWNKIVSRVEGVNFGNRYATASGNIMGNIKVTLPDGHTWKSFTKYLLQSLPPPLEQHYRERIWSHMMWWRHNKEKTGVRKIYDAGDPKLESNRSIPSWRRVAKMILKNDYWAKSLGFAPAQSVLTRYRGYVDDFRLQRKEEQNDVMDG